MAEVTVTVPDAIKAAVEDAFGGSIEEHVQAVVDTAVERWTADAKAKKRERRMDKFDRLTKTDQGKVDVLLAKAPEPVPEAEPE